MLDDETILSLPTEDDLPYSDEKPVDNELQILVAALLRMILASIWADRFDWFFGVNMGIYVDPYQPAIGPDGFLSLGVERIRANQKLRLSYVLHQEQVMPQFVLEVVSQKPGGEYDKKFQQYAEMEVLYYLIHNPSHTRRDKHETFELYRLEQGVYVRQSGNPIWMPEIGLGIGMELGTQEGIQRQWLYWYDEQGNRYLPPEDALSQERVLRKREQLIRREMEEQLEAEQRQRSDDRQRSEQALEAAQQRSAELLQQERQSIALKLFQQDLSLETIAEITGFTLSELQALRPNT